MGTIESKRKVYRKNSLEVLEKSEKARNSDWHFLFDYLHHSAGMEIPEALKQGILKSGVNFHTAVRERQKIQAEGLYLPTDPEILAQRRKLDTEYREAYVQKLF